MAFAFPNHTFVIYSITQRFHGLFIAVELGRHTGHSRAAKAVKDNVAWVCIVQDIAHNGFVRHLGVVGMRIVNWAASLPH